MWLWPIMNKAIELNPNNPVGYDRRGFAFYNLRKYDDAIPITPPALKRSRTTSLTFSRRADTYVAMNQFTQAVPDLEAALKLKPDDFDTTQNLPYVQAKAGSAAAGWPPRRGRRRAPTPPPPEGMSMPMKIGIGVAALIVISSLRSFFRGGRARIIRPEFLRERTRGTGRNFFDTRERAASLATLFRRTRRGPMVVQNGSLTRLWDFYF